jgi:hypothetical protein
VRRLFWPSTVRKRARRSILTCNSQEDDVADVGIGLYWPTTVMSVAGVGGGGLHWPTTTRKMVLLVYIDLQPWGRWCGCRGGRSILTFNSKEDDVAGVGGGLYWPTTVRKMVWLVWGEVLTWHSYQPESSSWLLWTCHGWVWAQCQLLYVMLQYKKQFSYMIIQRLNCYWWRCSCCVPIGQPHRSSGEWGLIITKRNMNSLGWS